MSLDTNQRWIMEPTTARSTTATHIDTAPGLATKFRTFLQQALTRFPYTLRVTDWNGATWEVGRGEPHWCGRDLVVRLHEPAAARDLMALDAARFLDRFLEGSVDIEGNLYVMTDIRKHADLKLKLRHVIARYVVNRAFQNPLRAKVSVKSHYDIPQEALNVYLDRTYMSVLVRHVGRNLIRLDVEELTRVGRGPGGRLRFTREVACGGSSRTPCGLHRSEAGDDTDLLDVGCGYGGSACRSRSRHHPISGR